MFVRMRQLGRRAMQARSNAFRKSSDFMQYLKFQKVGRSSEVWSYIYYSTSYMDLSTFEAVAAHTHLSPLPSCARMKMTRTHFKNPPSRDMSQFPSYARKDNKGVPSAVRRGGVTPQMQKLVISQRVAAGFPDPLRCSSSKELW